MARLSKFGPGLLLLLAWGLHAAEPVHLTGETMGTTWSVKVVSLAPTNSSPARLRARIQSRLDELEQAFSTYRANSEVSRFNRQETTNWFPVSADTVAVVAEAQRISEWTGGAFDITIAPLVNLWGFGPVRQTTLPTARQIATARHQVGWKKLALRTHPPALRKLQPTLAIDLSGVAKGYAVATVAADLRESLLTNHLVQVAGEFFASGKNTDGRPWRVGLENATRPGQIQQVRSLSDQALSTSGNYRNQHEIAGQAYGHLLDPRTGWPVRNELAGVSVLAPVATTADALATALFVMGFASGADWARTNGIEAVFTRR